jgi:hypothetical protein
MAKKDAIESGKAVAKKEQGDIYISSTGAYFKAPDITVERLIDFKKNVYAQGLMLKQMHLIFNDECGYEVLDSNGNQYEDLEQDIKRMCSAKEVSLWTKIKMAWSDHFWFGAAFQNEVWNYAENNIYTMQKLRHLPAESFNFPPENAPLDIYSELLQGIILNTKNEIEFWQTIEARGKPQQLKNITMIKEPTSTKLAGESVILPIIPIISMLKFVWDTQIQQANRTGAKILFIKVIKPQKANDSNNNVGDMEYAKLVLQKWGKNVAYTLRENMEIIDPKIKDDSNNLEIIAALNQMLLDYISPIGFLTSGNDGAKLGGSDAQRERMVQRWIKSTHDWLEVEYSYMLQPYLTVNGYKDFTIKVHIPLPEIDMSELNIKRAEAGAKNKALFANEIRALLGVEELSEERLAELEEYYKRHPPDIAQFNVTSASSITEDADVGVAEDFANMGKRLAAGAIAALETEEE